jgi:prefoldin subunit 2
MQQQQVPSNILQQYRDILAECQKIQGKISELEVDRAEHVLVEETLQPLDPSRRAFRLVGECLVERTVQDVLPTIAANRENVSYYFLFLCLRDVQR